MNVVGLALERDTEQFETELRLNRELLKAAESLSAEQVRFLVDRYYQTQRHRIAFGAQSRTNEEADEPSDLMRYLTAQQHRTEQNIRLALQRYARTQPLGKWALGITGIGPVIAAGLLAHIDLAQCPSVGAIWRFAGLDPTTSWDKGEKRPWNAKLKRLCWIIGESFVKVQNNDHDVYGKVYLRRKLLEQERNEQGLFADQAAVSLREKRFGKDTDAFAWYSACFTADAVRQLREADASKRPALLARLKGEPGSGVPMLPPARLQLRAERYAVKLFLSAYWHVGYWIVHEQLPPRPYVIDRLDHAHYWGPPNLDAFPALADALRKVGAVMLD